MNSPILNRDFSHPADGWYQIEAMGEHPNRAAGVVQVIDEAAIRSIVERFNQDAAAGKLRHGNEMLIDHEHFSDQPDKESRAYGWLTELQNRADGIYGRVRWSKTGREAVDGGDYRFFSTEYDPKDCVECRVASGEGETNAETGESPSLATRHSSLPCVRPMKLDGLTLTNMNNNRGQKPITNRDGAAAPAAAKSNSAGDQSFAKLDGSNHVAAREGGRISEEGRGVPATSMFITPNLAAQSGLKSALLAAPILDSENLSNSVTQNQKNKMNTVAIKLGLAPDVSEEMILAEVSRLLNRVTEMIPHEDENKSLRERLGALDGEQVHTLLDLHGVRDEKIRNRLKPVLMGLRNRDDRVAALLDFGFKPEERRAPDRQPPRLLNRGEGRQPRAEAINLNEQALAQRAEAEIGEYKIRNRCSYAEARNAVRVAKPELFGLEKK